MEQYTFTQTHEFCIKENCGIIRQGCPICGASHKPDAPYWVYLEAVKGRPCWTCCKKHAPFLLAAVEMANHEHFFKSRPDLTEEEIERYSKDFKNPFTEMYEEKSEAKRESSCGEPF